MCILFIYSDPHPKPGCYRAIIASNRDEFYKRPAKVAYKCEETGVIGGRDMENGRQEGMWLGISTRQSPDYKFRFGALLNVTGEDRKPGGKPRGNIVTNFLSREHNVFEYTKNLHNISETFNPFNFVGVQLRVGCEINEAWPTRQQNSVMLCFSLGHGQLGNKILWLTPYNFKDGVHVEHISNAPSDHTEYEGENVLGFGNSPLKTPLQKVIKGRERFNSIISNHNEVASKEELVKQLIDLLKWDKRHLPDPELEKRLPAAYEPVSAVCVKFIEAGYGTRTHSIILVDYDWNVEFLEDTMTEPIDPNNPLWNSERIACHL